MTNSTPPGTLLAADVARIFTEERRSKNPDTDEMKADTVLSYLRASQRPLTGKPRRYTSNPMPAPAGRVSRVPWWREDQEAALRAWFNSRAGQGHGRGGRYAGRKTATS